MLVDDIKQRYNKKDKITVVSPDVGGVVRARATAKRLNADLAIIDKRREQAGVSEVMISSARSKAEDVSSLTISWIAAGLSATQPLL